MRSILLLLSMLMVLNNKCENNMIQLIIFNFCYLFSYIIIYLLSILNTFSITSRLIHDIACCWLLYTIRTSASQNSFQSNLLFLLVIKSSLTGAIEASRCQWNSISFTLIPSFISNCHISSVDIEFFPVIFSVIVSNTFRKIILLIKNLLLASLSTNYSLLNVK